MAEDTGWPESAQTQDRWAEFVKGQAARAGALAGGMTNDIGPGQTALQRATPTINEFTGDKVRRVFEVLAPELPDGVTKFRFSDRFRIVEGVDAADYREAGR